MKGLICKINWGDESIKYNLRYIDLYKLISSIYVLVYILGKFILYFVEGIYNSVLYYYVYRICLWFINNGLCMFNGNNNFYFFLVYC